MKTEWAVDFRYLCPAPLDPKSWPSDLNWLTTAAAFRVLGGADVSRGGLPS